MSSLLQKISHNRFSSDHIQLFLNICFGILFGFLWFLLLYGSFTLNYSHVDWIYRAGYDTFQHQLGWEWFRQEPWRFPLGRIGAYGYPFGTNVTFMDSIPLMAIPFKVLSPWLGKDFQYQGLWELLSVICQMLIGMLILQEFTRSYFQKILGASLLVLSPIILFRAFMQDSLTAQWILLAAIWFIILEYRDKLWRGAWLILLTLSMMIHLYFSAMLIPLYLISLYFRFSRNRKRWIVNFAVDILTAAGVLLLVGYSIGIFSINVSDLSIDGNDYYTWNLNGFLNPNRLFTPNDTSAFLKTLPLGTDGQYEGYSYLGLGNLLILPLALFLFLQKEFSRQKLYFLLPFGITAILYGLYALSNKAFINAETIWNFVIPSLISFLINMFHAAGRFIWPVFYFLVLFGIISIVRNVRYATLILLLAVIIQFIDLQPLYVSKRISNGLLPYQSPLQSEFWKYAAGTNRHIILIPAKLNAITILNPIALYARENKLTLNFGYFGRGPYSAIENYTNGVWTDIKAGKVDPDTLYIFWEPEYKGLVQKYLSDHMLICQIDGFSVGLSVVNKLKQTNFDLSHFCVAP